MRIRAITTLVTLLCASAASAHDFWLEPEKFAAERNEPVAVYFTIGHEGAHEPWNLRLEKVTSFKSCNTGKCVDETDLVGDAPGERGRARVAFARAGTHILAFESRPSFSELGADAFTDYAKKEGLTAVLKDRQMRRTEGDPGRELYSRRAKTLIQVHGADPGDVSAAVGHTLEIVPLKNPYALHPGATLPVRVLYDGEPLSGATIDLDDLSDELDALQSAKTDQDGSASFTIDGAGPFKLMTIWSAPRPERSRANYETIFASLTFGR